MVATDYLLHLADSALVLGQRNAEWCGHGPVLEEDIAMANISLDLVGQARLLYQLAATRLGGGATEDSLAYFRDAPAFRNHTLLELPNHGPLVGYAQAGLDYATTVVRQFLHSALMVQVWDALATHPDNDLAAIAAKSVKEARYHLRHCRAWVVRFGDGTATSHQRAQGALDHLMPYTQAFWTPVPAGWLDTAAFRSGWDTLVDDALTEATLQRPPAGGHVPMGHLGQHSEHLTYLLGEMHGLARAHPHAQW